MYFFLANNFFHCFSRFFAPLSGILILAWLCIAPRNNNIPLRTACVFVLTRSSSKSQSSNPSSPDDVNPPIGKRLATRSYTESYFDLIHGKASPISSAVNSLGGPPPSAPSYKQRYPLRQFHQVSRSERSVSKTRRPCWRLLVSLCYVRMKCLFNAWFCLYPRRLIAKKEEPWNTLRSAQRDSTQLKAQKPRTVAVCGRLRSPVARCVKQLLCNAGSSDEHLRSHNILNVAYKNIMIFFTQARCILVLLASPMAVTCSRSVAKKKVQLHKQLLLWCQYDGQSHRGRDAKVSVNYVTIRSVLTKRPVLFLTCQLNT